MTVTSIAEDNSRGLTASLRVAQAAMHLPEVQAMLRKLSEYHLGICMPHLHDEQTGEIQALPDELIQVESGLHVSFTPGEEIANQTDHFLPVGWLWRAGASTPVAVCEMAGPETSGDSGPRGKHKMLAT